MKDQVGIIAKHASLEAARRYAMKPSDGPGVNAHSCAPDAAIGFLAELGYNPESFDGDSLAIASLLLKVGYCLGSEAADERWQEDLNDISGDYHTEFQSLRRQLDEAKTEADILGTRLYQSIAKAGRLQDTLDRIKLAVTLHEASQS